jgi:hypothetical protein
MRVSTETTDCIEREVDVLDGFVGFVEDLLYRQGDKF